MNTNNFICRLASLLLVILLLGPGCTEHNGPAVTTETVHTYTCPMHPQIIQHKPGTCPICGMDLVAFDKNNIEESLSLNASQRALANISVMELAASGFSNSIRLNARLAVDPEKTVRISSRVAGRIETLYVKESGVKVQQGQALYRIYSEQLSALQQEYLMLHDQVSSFPTNRHFRQLAAAAKQKLVLYGQTEKQITELLNRRNADPYITYFAPAAGVVATIEVVEGQYVEEGGLLMQLETYDHLWVEVDVYPSYADKVEVGQQVRVVVPGYEDEPQPMTIRFIIPTLQSGSQLLQARGSIENPQQRWQPGLRATVWVPAAAKAERLSLPVDAVIRDGRGAHVWVETDDHIYEPREVNTGAENAEQVEITSGLEAGAKVVVTGAYLLYSEYVLKKGRNPIAENHYH